MFFGFEADETREFAFDLSKMVGPKSDGSGRTVKLGADNYRIKLQMDYKH